MLGCLLAWGTAARWTSSPKQLMVMGNIGNVPWLIAVRWVASVTHNRETLTLCKRELCLVNESLRAGHAGTIGDITGFGYDRWDTD